MGNCIKAHVDRLRPWLAIDPAEENLPIDEIQLTGTQGLVPRWRKKAQAPSGVRQTPSGKAGCQATPAKQPKKKVQKKKKKAQQKRVVRKNRSVAVKQPPPVPLRRSARVAGRMGIT